MKSIYISALLCSLTTGSLMFSSPLLAEEAHHSPHWHYEHQEDWGMIEDIFYRPPYPFADCGIGQKQSPVNIETTKAVSLTAFDSILPDYMEVPLNLTNNGHTVRFNTRAGDLKIGLRQYQLLQFHFHAPSEHLFNGQPYPMEIHFVNGSEDGRLAVIGVFIKEGQFNPDLQVILDQSPREVGVTHDRPALFIPQKLLPQDRSAFYTYAGSLTTPPCSEGVEWFVLHEPLEASKEQIKLFTDQFYQGNARYEQKLNGRKLSAVK